MSRGLRTAQKHTEHVPDCHYGEERILTLPPRYELIEVQPRRWVAVTFEAQLMPREMIKCRGAENVYFSNVKKLAKRLQLCSGDNNDELPPKPWTEKMLLNRAKDNR